MWYVYILKCSDNSFYTGVTNNPSRRLAEHNNKKGGKYTRIRTPVELIYKEVYPSKSQALKREIQIKGWTKQKKLALINNDREELIKLSKSNK